MQGQRALTSRQLDDSYSNSKDLFFKGPARQNHFSELLQFCLALLGLVLAAPVFLIVGVLIKLISPGPIFYRGLRVGKDRQVFRIYKFRSLQVGAEEQIGGRLLTEQDTYYTTIGKFLKRTKLDELPQLLNVLKGEMNLVGPRPIRPIFLESLCQHIPLYPLRFMVKPGMTGLAQIKGGYFTHPKDKLRYELLYIRNRSTLLDLKLIFLTLFKLLNRWFTLGLLCLVLFLFVSFASENISPSTHTYVFGIRFNVGHLLIILGGGWLLAKRIPNDKLYLYRSPLNLPMLLFFALSLITSCFALQPLTALRGSVYYAVTGFLIVLLIVNGNITSRFIKTTTRTVAILTVMVSFVGLFELFVFHHSFVTQVEAGMTLMPLDLPRISSTLGSPVVLSTYLILGFPLLLCELAHAETKNTRDFWLICTTTVFIGIILTQTRMGLLALAVTGAAFFLKRSKRHFGVFLVGCTLLFLLILSLGGPRYSPRQALLEWKQAVASTTIPLSNTSVGRFLIGIGARNFNNTAVQTNVAASPDNANENLIPVNMHLILFIENGVIGWLIMMWILGGALKSFFAAYKKVKDPHLQLILWAIFSSATGFFVSMNGSAVFHNLSIQVIFWSLLGIGMAITVHFTDRKNGFIRLWRFGE